VLPPVINDAVVDLVGDRNQIELLAEPGDALQLLAGEDPSRGIVRSVEET
jgi:hypothetical protein